MDGHEEKPEKLKEQREANQQNKKTKDSTQLQKRCTQ